MSIADPGRKEFASDLRRSVIRLARRLRAERSAGALSSGKAGVLGHLFRAGPSTAGEIAAAEHQQPQSLTRVFASLEADGLIERARSEEDGRRSVLALTERGREVLTHDMAGVDGWLADALNELSEIEVGLLALVAPLLDRLSDAAEGDANVDG